jgi:hypothetical protein
VGFHQVVVCGDFQRKLQLYGKLVDIKVEPIVSGSGRPKSHAAAACCRCQCCGGHV